MAREKRATRAFGRKYVIAWDAEVGRFHVALGAVSIGYHKEHDGARAIAEAHARCTTLPAPHRQQPYSIETVGQNG